MTDRPAEPQAEELLRAIGKVQGPEARVLEDAREVLWSAVANEMLGIDRAGEQTTAAPGPAETQEQQPRTTRQRQTGGPQNERKMTMGKADPDN